LLHSSWRLFAFSFRREQEPRLVVSSSPISPRPFLFPTHNTSPDGKSIVYVVSRMNLEQDSNDRDLVLQEIATGARRALTHDRKDAGSPRWSPTGDRIAFLAAVGPVKEEKAQIFVLSMSGGDALKITDAPNGVEQFAWRPLSRDIAYVTTDEAENPWPRQTTRPSA